MTIITQEDYLSRIYLDENERQYHESTKYYYSINESVDHEAFTYDYISEIMSQKESYGELYTQRFRWAMNFLTDRQKEVLRLHLLSHSQVDIARMLNTTQPNVSKIMTGNHKYVNRTRKVGGIIKRLRIKAKELEIIEMRPEGRQSRYIFVNENNEICKIVNGKLKAHKYYDYILGEIEEVNKIVKGKIVKNGRPVCRLNEDEIFDFEGKI